MVEGRSVLLDRTNRTIVDFVDIWLRGQFNATKIPGQIDNSLLSDAGVAAGDDNRLAVHPGVGAAHTAAKIPKIVSKITS